MDNRRFDDLTRLAASSRRQLFKTLLGAVGGGVLAAAGRRSAAACLALGAPCTKRTAADCCSGRCAGGVCACPPRQSDCGGLCVDVRADPANCGDCGLTCAPGQICRNGKCRCPSGTTLCGGACVATASDPNNCGGCGFVCTASSSCATPVCNAGVCGEVNRPNGTACDDGNACTLTDACQNGVCVGGNPVVCVAADQCHDAGTCDPATGLCSNPPKPDGSLCDDGNACTQTDTCQNGACVGTDPVVCSGADACHDAGTCDPATGACSSPVLKAGFCFIDGACVAAGQANPGDPCRVCDPTRDPAEWSVAADGTPCSDANACTDTETCQAGVCTPGTTVVCPPAGDCQEAGVCNPSTGLCEYAPKPDGTLCTDDGNLCTIDVCEAGTCLHKPRDCNDFDPCTIDSCNPVDGSCGHEPIDCDDGNACTIDSCVEGECVHEPLDCEGDDPCVNFGCDPEFGCTQEPVDCEDGDLCTTDYCNEEGLCVHDPIECGDGPPCTTGSCDPDAGCVYELKECPAGEELDLEDCECKPRCTKTQTECGGQCTDLKSDSNNCGACGNVCTTSPDGCTLTCVNGRCDYIPMNCGGAACCVGKSCCIGTVSACCLNPGDICWSEGNLGNFVHCSPP